MNHSRTDFVILGLLTVGSSASGYDIRKAVESSIGYFWSESYGQIYPTLKRLAKKGLIQPSAATPNSRRQQYSITPAGRESLQQWLAQPFYNEPPRNEFLLKLFFGGEAPIAVSVAHIHDLNQKNRQMLSTALEIEAMAEMQPPQNPHPRCPRVG
jgi:DNA-binding PadR family transcriptional regulator